MFVCRRRRGVMRQCAAPNPVVIPRESGGPSTPRPTGLSRASLEYGVARSSRAMTSVGALKDHSGRLTERATEPDRRLPIN
jgi:hypothetical protein